MGWRWCRAEAEQEIQLVDAIGDIDLVIIVTVASVHTGAGSTYKQIGEHIDGISDVAAPIAVGIATDEKHLAKRQLEAKLSATTFELFTNIIL